MVAPRGPSHYVRVTTDRFFSRNRQPGERQMKKDYEGLPAARNIQESITQAQLQIVKDLERRKQSAAAVQRLIDSVIDSVTRVAA
jgi:hypothetical protein